MLIYLKRYKEDYKMTNEIYDEDLEEEKGSRKQQIETISQKMFEIRKALGFATNKQTEEGWQGEVPTVKSMIDSTKKYKEHSTGGFTYKLAKDGKSVVIIPAFGWIVKAK